MKTPAPRTHSAIRQHGNTLPDSTRTGGQRTLLAAVVIGTAVVTIGVAALLVSIFEHKQEARRPFVRLVEVDEATTDPAVWGVNWPDQYDSYLRTVDTSETEYGGSSAMPASKLESHPWLKRLYAGYAFSIDYREARGHAYMLHDQEVTERVTKRTQSGACLHCHASIVPTYRRMGLESMEQDASPEALAAGFNWPAVMEGFRIASTMDYATAHAELFKTPDGSPAKETAAGDGGEEDGAVDGEDVHAHIGDAHPVGCIDCHDPDSMHVRVTRPGFVNGIAALARSDDPVPHLPSINRWREGDRKEPYDPNRDASRQEMRTFVCAQCHVEYYCASKETLFFPWENGLKAEQIEETFDNHKFPDGTAFYDYKHGETGAPVYKAQHPEFELWNQGIHARAGVSCADCHMPYERRGAMKVSSHWVRSPLLSINRSCQTCHNVPEEELKGRVEAIQARTQSLLTRAADAMTDMLDAIRAAQAAGATDEELQPIFELQKKGMWRLDFISSENSKGFHADQEAARLLGESIDYCRQAQAMALQLRAPDAPESDRPVEPVQGVTPAEKPTEP
ncbi:ammonia-forming cytochrome c nitrite reductase subunit c552 [Maioricimonas sp. JC845]|uniref:ammonia-forming cytochrome c nitrite reductase subunit c552 n=1 Tax=Maioricimonas sp. JC845 TaxID=3232138 RepID=UPI003459587D